MSRTQVSHCSHPRTQLQATLIWSDQNIEVFALLDSGAEESFINSDLVSQIGLSISDEAAIRITIQGSRYMI